MLNFYPPYLGTGIRVNEISPDWHFMRVSMNLRWFNRNAVGTHFGGSLFSMADPHLMLMLLRILGKDYHVWDLSSSIRFVKPGKGRVTVLFQIEPEMIEDILENTKDGQKYLPEFTLEIKDQEGEVVAEIKKILYIRLKKKR